MTAPSNPEFFAGSLLGRVDAAGILRFLELLPSEAPARGSRTVGVASEFSFTTGAYTYDHGARHGLRQNCRDFPRVTQALNEFMRARAPDARYTTLALFRDLRTSVHADKGNDPCQVNTNIPLQGLGPPAVRRVMTIVIQVLSGPLVPCIILLNRFWMLRSQGPTQVAVPRRMQIICQVLLDTLVSRLPLGV